MDSSSGKLACSMVAQMESDWPTQKYQSLREIVDEFWTEPCLESGLPKRGLLPGMGFWSAGGVTSLGSMSRL